MFLLINLNSKKCSNLLFLLENLLFERSTYLSCLNVSIFCQKKKKKIIIKELSNIRHFLRLIIRVKYLKFILESYVDVNIFFKIIKSKKNLCLKLNKYFLKKKHFKILFKKLVLLISREISSLND